MGDASGAGDGDVAGFFSSSSRGDKHVESAEDIAAEVDQLLRTNAAANRLPQAKEAAIRKSLFAFFGAKSAEEKTKVKRALLVYFMTNMPSGRTDWAKANPIVVLGKSYPANAVVGPIIPLGEAGILKFLRCWSADTAELIASSNALTTKLATRTAKAGLRPGQEMYVVPWIEEAGMDSKLKVRARGGLTATKADPDQEAEREARKAAVDVTDAMWTA